MMKILPISLLSLILVAAMAAQKSPEPPKQITFSTYDGGTIYALQYGKGKHGVVLAHGGRFKKESWAKQAEVLAKAGFHVVAFDFRGFGSSAGPGQTDMFTAPLYLDVLAAVAYLRKNGARTVSLVGGSFGGGAAADAVTRAKAGEISRLVTLGGLSSLQSAEKINVPLLVITTRDDSNSAGSRLPNIQAAFDKVPGKKKELVILEGSAHAQFMFDTDQGETILNRIVMFLKK